MQIRGPLLCAFLLFSASISPGQNSADGSAATLYAEGRRAYQVGDLDTAKERFAMVLIMEPRHLAARNYLKMIAAQEKNAGGTAATRQLATLKISKVSFQAVPLSTALDFLRAEAERTSSGKVQPNFVVQIAPETLRKMTVTLELSDVPFTEVLRYVTDLTGTTATVDAHAIVIQPRT